MKIMIIGIDASRANNEQKTGVEGYAYNVIQEFKKITPDSVRVILYSREKLKGDMADLPPNWESKVLHWPPKRLWTQVRLSFEMLVNPPDVLFIPAHVFPIIHPKKTVMMIHDIAATKFPQSYNWFERWYSLWSARLALKKLWRVIVPSEFVKKTLISDLGFKISDSDKIKVIKHGYDKRYRNIRDKEIIDEALEKYGVKQPFIMSVGRLEEKKNTRRIVEAFEQVRLKLKAVNLKLVLVGKPGHGYGKVKQAIQDSPYKDSIITPGYVKEEDLPYLMNAAEVFVFPSLYEGFGLPVLEAMASGTPVVASRGSSLEEVGGDACVYVDPESVDEIVEGVVRWLDGLQSRYDGSGSHRVRAGLERVKNFSWERCARETLKVLLS